MMHAIYRKIFNAIKKYDKIVIARHIGADPDALGSSIGLKEIIQETFPNKTVYVVGTPAAKFKYLGMLDKITEEMYEDSLLIVTDTPDQKRVDGVDVDRFSYRIKIDHHPFIEKFCEIEWIDDSASSASQMIIELCYNTKFKMPKEAAEKLYIGLVADTDRFLFSYTTSKTFSLVSHLIKDTKLDFFKLYTNLYMRPFKEMKFEGYIANNLEVTEHGFAYIKLSDEILHKYDVDAATAGNMVNNFNYIENVYAWAVFSDDKANHNIRGSIRSRGPIINEVASRHNGGGHKCASGVRLKNFDEVDILVKELDLECKKYQEQ